MSESTNEPIIGIDLGTTNSVVAVVIDGRPEVLPDASGQPILPSVVGLDPAGQLLSGAVARNQLAAFPDRTIASVKRHMGSTEKCRLGDQEFSPQEISAIILRRLRDRASARLGTDVRRAVITVPAFFDENQRQATREAGELAGLKVERIINEPTAATLVYHAGSDRRRHIVVYDLGGGTFDVSVVRMESGVVEVLSSKGDTRLGGDDFDARLMNHVADQFLTEQEIDLRKDAGTRWRLLRACEQAKCRLSADTEVAIAEEFIAQRDGQPLNLNVSITRDEYQSLIEGMIDRTIECVDEALRDAKLRVSEIDDLVLVGGSTRTPLVQERLRQEFDLEPSRGVDPDLAVALGAGIQAAMQSGQGVGPVLVDVTGHTLGIEVLSGGPFDRSLEFSPIIHRNTPLPASFVESYYKVADEQTTAKIRVYQGEHRDLSRNRPIGSVDVDLASGGGDKKRVDVRFDLNLDGILHVTTTQPATGKQAELRIDNALSTFRDEERDEAKQRLGEMFDAVAPESQEAGFAADAADAPETTADTVDAESWVDRATADWQRGDAPAAAVSPPNVVTRATRLIERAKRLRGAVSGEDAEELEELTEQLQAAIADDDHQRIEDICTELDDVMFYVE